ncbi:DUF1223 domain-containing protein [Pinibacter soli]|uniref:DUF1223 domain-containing protein n=1 Tax=Pinibacter soli TaxID=3044211 RepID=A0ABT6RA88_9BACT|nr:DUF1223 domain-containing protein [Pinibacter soli]MDI3319460.1 DUF1223 domain-containing protein [Pinibacter soli]
MKSVKLMVAGTSLALTFITAVLINNTSAQTQRPASLKNDGFAVLELFTSEGCSSCPPAEALLANIQQHVAGKPIYILAYHVDYWDRLGWKDPFSDAKFTARQYQYNKQFTREVYTPQLIINGKEEFVGSEGTAIEGAISSALEGSTTATLSVKGYLHKDSLSVSYNFSGIVSDQQLVLAVVQRQATSSVRAGENEGKTLSHVQLVRNLYSMKLKGQSTGTFNITLPEQFSAKDWEVIGFVQNKQNGAINAAASIGID